MATHDDVYSAEAERKAEEYTPVFTTKSPHQECGYFKILNHSKGPTGNFVGDIEVCVPNPGAGEVGRSLTFAATIKSLPRVTEVNVLPDGTRQGFTIMLPSLKSNYEAIKSPDGEINIAYQLARAITENFGDEEAMRRAINGFKTYLEANQPRFSTYQF